MYFYKHTRDLLINKKKKNLKMLEILAIQWISTSHK